jgi:hypothetical protein
MSEPGFWLDLLGACTVRLAHRRRRLQQYRDLIESGAIERATGEYAAMTLRLQPPLRRSINRSGGRRKVLFLFQPADELFLRGLNAAIQPLASGLHSRLCHSFQPGRGVRTAYNQILGRAGLDAAACARLDVRDYFNSIPPQGLLNSLPAVMRRDGPLQAFLTGLLLDDRVISEGAEVHDSHKGVMAGTPTAPLLSNLYLRSLDFEFEGSGGDYLRYADDFIVLGSTSAVTEHVDTIARRLGDRGLQLNPDKTRRFAPGEAWDFLGLRYHKGTLDLADNTVRKMHHRVRRLARKARTGDDPVHYFLKRLNRRVYGIGGDEADFTWATWFFPMLSADTSLRRLDAVIQEQARFAATGRHERRNRRLVPYPALTAAGYIPLVSAFHTYRRGPTAYEALLDRAGLWEPGSEPEPTEVPGI